MLNLRNLMLGGLERLRYVNRYSTFKVTHYENIAEHSFYCAIYALAIARWVDLEKPELKINLESVLCRALLHDIEEAATGDVPRHFKYSSEKLRKTMDEAAIIGCQRIIRPIWEETDEAYFWIDLWKSAKDDTCEGRILEFADYLSALAYIWEELNTGNVFFKEHLETTNVYAQLFQASEYNFLRSLVNQADILISEIMAYAK